MKILINHQGYGTQNLFKELEDHTLYSVSSDTTLIPQRSEFQRTQQNSTHLHVENNTDRLHYAEEIVNFYNNNDIDLFFPLYNDMLLEGIHSICGFTENQKNILSNKDAYYKFFQKNKIPTPETFTTPTFPCIAKPVNGTGSIGVKYLASQTEYNKFISNDVQYRDLGKGYVYQEYIQGNVVTVAGRVVNNEVIIDCIYDIENSELPYRAEVGFTYPSKSNSIDEIKKHSIRAVESLGLNNKVWMIDFIDSNGGVYLIDFSARMSSSLGNIVNNLNSTVYSKIVVNTLLGIEDTLKLDNKCVVYRYFDLPKGQYSKKDIELPSSCVSFCSPEENVYMSRIDMLVKLKGWAVCIADTLEECERDWHFIFEQLK